MTKYLDQIEAYKQKTLPPDQVAELERAMSEDPDLQLLVDHYDVAKGISRDLLDVDMRATLGRLQQAELAPPKRSIVRLLLASAAVAVLLVSAWVLFTQSATSKKADQIYADTSLQPATMTAKHRGVVVDKTGYDYLNLNQYDEAIEAFEQDLSREGIDQNQTYYALAYTCAVKGDLNAALRYASKSDLQQARKLESIITQ